MSKVSGGLCSPAHTGKPGGSPRPQIKEQLQQLGEPSDSFQEGITFSKWEPQIWDAWLSASTPTSCSLTSPAYLSDHTFPAHGAWTFANRPYRQALWSPPSQVPAQHFAGTRLTSTVLSRTLQYAVRPQGGGSSASRPAQEHTRTHADNALVNPSARPVACCSPTRCCLGEAGGGCRRWRADAGMQAVAKAAPARLTFLTWSSFSSVK